MTVPCTTSTGTVLEFDGRSNPYEQKEFKTTKKEYNKWLKEWEHFPDKAQFVNNYDHLEFEKIEE